MKRTIGLSALVAGALLSAGGASAQASDNSGFMLNLHLAGNGITPLGEGTEAETGGGGGLAIGYGFNDRIILYLNVDAAAVEYDEDVTSAPDDTYDLVHGDLGVRVNFGHTGLKLRPYINAAFTGIAAAETYELVGEDVDQIISGGGLTVGGGLQYFFSPKLALDLGLQATQGAFTQVTIDDEDEELGSEDVTAFTTSRVQLGVSWHP
ncbi:outer membrane beta-barrel protein [Longimicrobium sp.]|uniref:outer membrane beta-barrel protein n=1 Tax=Longimicrobium sp. TaxID=2029185 RepID=UPI002E3552D6|nr:outer membrane beta-barrel protein [Longimicrobium sp.]HEX6041406.1 outer membrane beta-barrel protein [Longimicrobium sp.]